MLRLHSPDEVHNFDADSFLDLFLLADFASLCLSTEMFIDYFKLIFNFLPHAFINVFRVNIVVLIFFGFVFLLLLLFGFFCDLGFFKHYSFVTACHVNLKIFLLFTAFFE